jgi:hypothetical protein
MDKAQLEAADVGVRRRRPPDSQPRGLPADPGRPGQIQLYVDRKGLDADTLSAIKSWDLGDIVARGAALHRSGKGDLYINMARRAC